MTEPTQNEATLRTENLVKIYGGRTVVNHVSIELHKGEIVGLLGPNGAGKTTSFNMVVGIVKPNEGRIYLAGRDITDLPLYKRARHGLGYLAQETSVFRKLTVEENILGVLQALKIGRDEQKARLEMLLDDLGIGHLADHTANTLSGGERRRLEIARALATKPQFMLLDEPFSGVDPKAVEEIQEIIYTMRDAGLGVLITDHSVRETLAVTDRAYIIHDGTIRVQGSPETIVNDPEARRLYLGESFYMQLPADKQKSAKGSTPTEPDEQPESPTAAEDANRTEEHVGVKPGATQED